MVGHTAGRLPDFVIIGAGKAGTTSLFRWLGEQPEIMVPGTKELHFFSHDSVWRKGPQWYREQFAAARADLLTGEASTSYTSPVGSGRAANRMAATVPEARLVYLVRHPVDRLRSHYRHAVQRGRRPPPLAQAVLEPGNPFVGESLYYTCLRPYIDRFPRAQLCVVRFEDLVSQDRTGWRDVLLHLGLSPRPAPTAAYNVTAQKTGYSQIMRWLSSSAFATPLEHLPQAVRQLAKPLLLRQGSHYEQKLQAAEAPLPTSVPKQLAEEAARLQDWLGLTDPLWDVHGEAPTSVSSARSERRDA